MQSYSRRSALRLLVGIAGIGTAGRVLANTREKTPLAIKGYDPVAYFTVGKAVRGRPEIAYDWDERRYLFSRAQHRDLFKSDPVKYAPQFSNFCAMSLAKGELVEADPESWTISDGKLYLFGKTVGPELFRQDLSANIAKANQHRGMVPRR